MLKKLNNVSDAKEFIKGYGMCTLLKTSLLPELSLEYNQPERLWATDNNLWEWKKDIVRERKCLYGRIFNNKIGFIRKDLAKDLINYRRDGYDFDSLINSTTVSEIDIMIYNTILKHKVLSAKSLRRMCSVSKETSKEFEKALNRLQMETYICVSSFEYEIDKNGDFYGWGTTYYSTPELLFGEKFIEKAYEYDPSESYSRLIKHLKKTVPDHDDKELIKFIKYSR